MILIISINLGDVSRKWNNLKSYYTYEYQKYMKAKQCEGAPDTLEIDWKNKSKMDFLQPLLIPVDPKRLCNVCINTSVRLHIFCFLVVIMHSITLLIIIIITCCCVV